MFLLDTNVISEARRGKRAHPAVLAWVDGRLSETFFLSAVTILELEIGVLAKARTDAPQAAVLRKWLDERILPEFEARILSVDRVVAQRCARLHVPRTRSYRDSFIAATALVHGLTVVTRNVKDFLPTGVDVLNPWEIPIAN
jgi:predicted nucleic acid-binding protein